MRIYKINEPLNVAMNELMYIHMFDKCEAFQVCIMGYYEKNGCGYVVNVTGYPRVKKEV